MTSPQLTSVQNVIISLLILRTETYTLLQQHPVRCAFYSVLFSGASGRYDPKRAVFHLPKFFFLSPKVGNCLYRVSFSTNASTFTRQNNQKK
jgi:hypothetical protein